MPCPCRPGGPVSPLFPHVFVRSVSVSASVSHPCPSTCLQDPSPCPCFCGAVITTWCSSGCLQRTSVCHSLRLSVSPVCEVRGRFWFKKKSPHQWALEDQLRGKWQRRWQLSWRQYIDSTGKGYKVWKRKRIHEINCQFNQNQVSNKSSQVSIKSKSGVN